MTHLTQHIHTSLIHQWYTIFSLSTSHVNIDTLAWNWQYTNLNTINLKPSTTNNIKSKWTKIFHRKGLKFKVSSHCHCTCFCGLLTSSSLLSCFLLVEGVWSKRLGFLYIRGERREYVCRGIVRVYDTLMYLVFMGIHCIPYGILLQKNYKFSFVHPCTNILLYKLLQHYLVTHLGECHLSSLYPLTSNFPIL